MSSTVEDLAVPLQAAGLGVWGTTIFGSLRAVIPTGAGPFTHLIGYGSASPGETHDDDGTAIDSPRVQVSVHATSYAVAEAHAKACARVLSRIQNQRVNNVPYLRVAPLEDPFELTPDANNRAVVAFNVQADKAAT